MDLGSYAAESTLAEYGTEMRKLRTFFFTRVTLDYRTQSTDGPCPRFAIHYARLDMEQQNLHFSMLFV